MNKGAHIWCRMFGITKWKLLIIESFFHWKLNKTKIENYIGIWGCYWYCWKTLTKSNFIEFETEDVNNIIDFLLGIIVGNLKNLQKGVWKENPIECIHTWANDTWYLNV
jgi:hypothetical protein